MTARYRFVPSTCRTQERVSGRRRLNSCVKLVRLAVLLTIFTCTTSLLAAQFSPVLIGHNRLVFPSAVSDSYGYFSPPSPTETISLPFPYCAQCNCTGNCWYDVPPFKMHGIIMWINDDSGWQPVSQITDENGNSRQLWCRLYIGGRETVRFRDSSGVERDYRIYFLRFDPLCDWQPSRWFVFEPHPDRSVWETRRAEERDLVVYIDAYAYYWRVNVRTSVAVSCNGKPPTEEERKEEGGYHTGSFPPPDGDGTSGGSGGNRACWCYLDDPNDSHYRSWMLRSEDPDPDMRWDGTPDFAGKYGKPHLCATFNISGQGPCSVCLVGRDDTDTRVSLLFRGKVGSVPIIGDISQSADAAVDSRLVCPDPSQSPSYPKFGTYKFLGGLFVGQVPQDYSRCRGQTAPDLSGTGRTLLKFYHPNMPTQVAAACVSLAYTATPQGVAESTPTAKAIGAVAVPSSDWDESSVSWAFLEQIGLGNPLGGSDNRWIGSTKDLRDYAKVLIPREENSIDQGNLQIRPERRVSRFPESWESHWRQIRRVVVPLTNWTARGRYLSLLLALHPEESQVNNSYVWYYFLGKEHELTNERNCPRLWYVVRGQ